MSTDDHVDLAALIAGDLSPVARRSEWAHVRSCRTCQGELIETTALIAELRDARRHAPVDPAEVPPFRLDLDAPPAPPVRTAEPSVTWRQRLTGRTAVGIAAAVVALAVGFGIGERGGSPAPPARVALAAVGTLPSAATGDASMSGAGQTQTMNLTVSGLQTPPSGDHYEVWLLDTRTGRTLAVGQISPSASGVMSFPLPASSLAGFDALDISLQRPADGAHHSGNSLLRGALA